MCGRFRLGRAGKYLQEAYDAAIEENWPPHYNIAPTQQIATIRQDAKEPVRRFSAMRWGLVPSWAKDLSIGARTINARAETLDTTPAFRDAFQSRRCLVPADGFYEWQKQRRITQPYCLMLKTEEPFAFAGLWDRWKGPDGWMESCTIVTTMPNALTADIHDRMPVILRREDYDTWMDPGFKHAPTLRELLRPYDAGSMKRFPVSSRVNSPANDDEECAKPVEVTQSQATLF